MLLSKPDMTKREIAKKLSISARGLNYFLKALIDKGWAKVHNFGQSKKFFTSICSLLRA